ncbi:hypothetical protein Y1Q_0002742 [Alligator mississippiensis]|uniref:Uncharacterized protein n=1 Tax=Alligator mississippiensis TaxID=8496 RepID=A0A151NZN5_ALLMI|nr:hypothetical protein Y1Q_0002742 [Alligator mississippiensis]
MARSRPSGEEVRTVDYCGLINMLHWNRTVSCERLLLSTNWYSLTQKIFIKKFSTSSAFCLQVQAMLVCSGNRNTEGDLPVSISCLCSP